MSEPAIINPNRYSDLQSSSFLPTSGRIGGRELWFAETVDSGQMRTPLSLGLRGDNMVVSYGSFLAALDRSDGSTRWKREIEGNHLVSMNQNSILNLNHAGYYAPLGYDGQPQVETLLSLASPAVQLQFAHASEDEIMYGYQMYPDPVNAPDMEMEKPFYQFVRLATDEWGVIWQHKIEGWALATLASADGERIYVATATGLYSFPADISTLSGEVTAADFAQIKTLSIDIEGNVLLVELLEEAGAELKRVSPDGEALWTVAFEDANVSSQPPASSPDGFVYLMVGRTLHQIRDGEIVWTYEAPPSESEAQLTILGDNSVLVAAGYTLVHVSADGDELLKQVIPSPIATRPVMDEKGRVYLGCTDGIRCLE